ncbi:MAG TPA: MOSC domain-containing protein [Acidobacteriota bacterium]
MKGTIEQINVKSEKSGERGLPKFSVAASLVTSVGLQDDFNRWRHEKDHDNRDQAVLLIPREMIEQLNREGWPIRPGDLGENFLTAGMEYNAFAVGKRFRLGAAVEIEISKPCQPCNNLYLLPYVGQDKGPSFLGALRDRRGWFARVLKEGRVKVGDSIAESE